MEPFKEHFMGYLKRNLKKHFKKFLTKSLKYDFKRGTIREVLH